MKGEVICNTAGNPRAETTENDAIQLETTHLHYDFAHCVAKLSAEGMGSQLSRGMYRLYFGCTSFVFAFSFVSSLLGVAAQYQARAKRARERKSQEGHPGVLLCVKPYNNGKGFFLFQNPSLTR